MPDECSDSNEVRKRMVLSVSVLKLRGDSCGEVDRDVDMKKKCFPFRIECTWRGGVGKLKHKNLLHFVTFTNPPTSMTKD